MLNYFLIIYGIPGLLADSGYHGYLWKLLDDS